MTTGSTPCAASRLLGILLVNIQSFVWGGTNPAGYLQDDATALDRALFFITVTFVNMKFMPLFAMLFGAGFSLLLTKLRSVTSAPHTVFRRRMLFLFVFGLLHGVLSTSATSRRCTRSPASCCCGTTAMDVASLRRARSRCGGSVRSR